MMTANRITVLAVLAFVACIMLLSNVVCAAQQPVAQAKMSMSDIDNALTQGPVFLEFETKECGYCKQQHPISQQLQSDYAGKVTFFFIDATENRDMAKAFQVTGVPQIDIIASKSDSKYTYVDKNGKPTDNVGSSRIIGLTQRDALKTALDAAVQLSKK